MKNNTIIVAFGRMNPPTIGHLKLINKLKSLADEKSDVKARLYLSHSHDDKKNPLTYEEKIDFATVAFGDKVDVMESDAKTIYSVLAELYREGFENVIYVCGEDRFDEFQGIKEYNGKKTTKIGRPIRDDLYYEFDSIEIENAGHRDDNSENPEEKASASYVRKLAVEGDFITFSEYVPFDNRTAMNLFNLLRKRLTPLDEAFVKRPNTHQTHFEDLVLLGPDGIAEIEDKIDKFLNNKDGLNMTSKIDGAPAVICYSKFTGYPDNSICLKSFVANANNVLSSEEDVMKKYGDRPSMAEKLVACLELAKLIPAGEAWQGDCLFSSDDKDVEEIRGKEYITFQPNKIVYAFSEENPGYENVKNADFGIAFHTVYKDDGNGGKSQSFRPAIESINWPEWVYVMSPALSLDNNSFNNDKIQKFADYFKENAEALAKMSSYEDIVNNEAFMSFWNTFENNYIADKKNETINCDTVIRELKEYIAEKQTAYFQKKFSSLKTAKGKMKSIDEWSDSVAELKEIIHHNKDTIIKMVEVLNIAITIKMLMWHGFKNSKQDYSTFYKSRSRGVIDANMEGVAMSDMDGNIVKIVDRTEFSSANRDSDILAGWEHPHDKVQESLNLFDKVLNKLYEANLTFKNKIKYIEPFIDSLKNKEDIKLTNGDILHYGIEYGDNEISEIEEAYKEFENLENDDGSFMNNAVKKILGLKSMNIDKSRYSGIGSGGNKGNMFESMLEFSINNKNSDKAYLKNTVIAIEKLIGKSIDDADQKGGLNQKRPLVVVDDKLLVSRDNTKEAAPVQDIGDVVTDVDANNDSIHLSCKYGPTTDIAGTGIKQTITPSMIDNGKYEGLGKIILDFFSLKPELFSSTFSDYFKETHPDIELPDEAIDLLNKRDFKKNICDLICSAFGYGYIFVHGYETGKVELIDFRNKTKAKNMFTGNNMLSAKLYYGGTTGEGKRVTIYCDFKDIKIGIIFRDKQGGNGMPTHLTIPYSQLEPDIVITEDKGFQKHLEEFA